MPLNYDPITEDLLARAELAREESRRLYRETRRLIENAQLLLTERRAAALTQTDRRALRAWRYR
ncbi:MAG: hypothetical protein JO021_09795 [Alphaproteobacteria bacterium]|nr:hypothetical protein [Alphaproteobacteria bacterium]